MANMISTHVYFWEMCVYVGFWALIGPILERATSPSMKSIEAHGLRRSLGPVQYGRNRVPRESHPRPYKKRQEYQESRAARQRLESVQMRHPRKPSFHEVPEAPEDLGRLGRGEAEAKKRRSSGEASGGASGGASCLGFGLADVGVLRGRPCRSRLDQSMASVVI